MVFEPAAAVPPLSLCARLTAYLPLRMMENSLAG
jgi:hypothetical protein